MSTLPKQPPPQSNAYIFSVLITGACAALVYGMTVAPTVTGEDSGELIAAAYELGIPHPPGYPLWTLLAHAAIKILPGDDVALRANYFSLLTSVLVACAVAHVVLWLTRSGAAAIAAGLALAFSFEFWEQSVIAEVYALQALLFVLSLGLMLAWHATERSGFLFGSALSTGAAVANHGLMLLALPALIVFAIVTARNTQLRPAEAVKAAACFALPFLVFLYLPIASSRDPAVDWGNPETLSAFWDVVSRAQYTGLMSEIPRTPANFAQQCWVFLSTFALQFTPWVLPIVLVGAIGAFRFYRPFGALLLALFVCCGFGAVLLTNFPLEERDIWLNTAYWIPAYIVAAIWIGLGVSFIAERFVVPRNHAMASVALVVFAVASPLAMHWTHNDRSEDRLVREYAENVLKTLPENAIYFGGGDHTLFPVMYLQSIGKRRDVTIANPYAYIVSERFPEMPGHLIEPDGVIPTLESERAMIAWLADNDPRPIYSADPIPIRGHEWKDAGLLYRLDSDPEGFWETYSIPELEPPVTPSDWTAKMIYYDYHVAQARGFLKERRPSNAVNHLERAAEFASRNKQLLNNVGVLAVRAGAFDVASNFFEAALRIDPAFETARENLERVAAIENAPS